MTAPEPVDITVTAGDHHVYINHHETEGLVMSPAQARHLAAELLTNADRAENKLPAHIYKVDRR